MIECAFCNKPASSATYDRDLGMYLCVEHYAEMNGAIESIELDEVF